jgi:hypothetical protein
MGLRDMRTYCDYLKACHVLYLVKVLRWTQTQAAIKLELNVGTVCHIVHGRRFPNAVPMRL